MIFMGMRPCRRASPADAMSQPFISPLKRPGAFEQTASLQFNARLPDRTRRSTGGDPCALQQDTGESQFHLVSADISPAVIDSDPISKQSSRFSLRLFDAHELKPQFPRRDDGQIPDSPKVEQFLVAGDEYVGFPGNGAGEDGNVACVPDRDRRIPAWFDDPAFRFQKAEEPGDHGTGEAQLAGEDPLELRQHRLARQQLVVMNDIFEKLAAEAARGDTAREDVRVQEDLHETSRNRSSSVR